MFSIFLYLSSEGTRNPRPLNTNILMFTLHGTYEQKKQTKHTSCGHKNTAVLANN